MLELRTLKYPMFTLGVAMIFITFMIPFAVNIILPTYNARCIGINTICCGVGIIARRHLNHRHVLSFSDLRINNTDNFNSFTGLHDFRSWLDFCSHPGQLIKSTSQRVSALILVAIGLILSFFIKPREKEAINSLGPQIEPATGE
jgi:hypothetical protein